MAKLLLVKHAAPRIDPEVVSHRWVLSEAGRAACDWLADELREQGVTRLFASLEPKALETAALVAVRTGLVIEPRQNLNENDRAGMGFLSQEALRRRIGEFFDRPTETVIGRETARDAERRFTGAVRAAVADAQGEDVAIVAHGTVISLLVTAHNSLAPFELWSALGVPSYVVVDPVTFAFDGEVHRPPA
jgi:broad specificity phosphatase PhoE